MNKKMREACLAVADVFEFAPECWTDMFRARNKSEVPVEPTDISAVSWCAIGGVSCAMKTDDPFPIIVALEPFARKLGYGHTSGANDKGGRLVAIKMLRLAGGES